jgi:hypothetical protein
MIAGTRKIVLEPGDAHHVVTDSVVVPEDADLIGIYSTCTLIVQRNEGGRATAGRPVLCRPNRPVRAKEGSKYHH